MTGPVDPQRPAATTARQDQKAARDQTGRKSREAAILLPLLGLLLITPPFVEIFAADVTLFGVPLLAAYLFAIWAGMIICAFLLSRTLSRHADGNIRPD
mgnify:CR=1 FL=1